MASSSCGWLAICIICLVIVSTRSSPTLVEIAKAVCDDIAKVQGTACNCVDATIVPNSGPQALCGNDKPLGNGLNVNTTTFSNWDSDLPKPTLTSIRSTTCNNQESAPGVTMTCSESFSRDLTIATTVDVKNTFGVKFEIGIPGIATLQVSTNEIKQNSSTTTRTLTANTDCGPGILGQPVGTCNVYIDQASIYDLSHGLGFTFDATIVGGFQISFENPTDLNSAFSGAATGGGTHYYWWVPVSWVVEYAQKVDIQGAKNFDPVTDRTNPMVTFRGRGVVGQQIQATRSCTVADC